MDTTMEDWMQGLVRRLRYCRASRPIEQQIAAITWQKETVSSNAAYLCGREMAEWCACNCEIQRGEGRWNGYRVCIVATKRTTLFCIVERARTVRNSFFFMQRR
ncbi:uncharacterized protein LOC105735507 [Apis florea]|uniref:uncharacterized protein LOC105735507 n=1 Tax=Apis florea TaxID=7463 RepID=UPI0006292CD2|nr:uncharacterized protein LOC105735507 [Apis florea]